MTAAEFSFTDQLVPRGYDEHLVPGLFHPWAEALVEQLAPRVGSRALDVATGPGTVARILARAIGPKGQVAACDSSAPMIDRARAKPEQPKAAPIGWTVAPAAPLPYPSASFELVTCQQGLQFFPDGGAALAEMRRVLIDGGRLAVSVWLPVEYCLPFQAFVQACVEAGQGDVGAALRIPFPRWTGEELAQRAREAGFGYVRVAEEERVWTLPGDLGQAVRVFFEGTPAARAIAGLPAEAREAIVAAAGRTFAPLRDGAGLRGAMRSWVLQATA